MISRKGETSVAVAGEWKHQLKRNSNIRISRRKGREAEENNQKRSRSGGITNEGTDSRSRRKPAEGQGHRGAGTNL